MTSVNLEISCIRLGFGPALFGLARFYCTHFGRFVAKSSSQNYLSKGVQWNLHKTDTIGEQPFGRYREVVFLGRFRLPATYSL